eukprot:scaffold25421_cov162-Amphora_coffeaeformis.AAC.4
MGNAIPIFTENGPNERSTGISLIIYLMTLRLRTMTVRQQLPELLFCIWQLSNGNRLSCLRRRNLADKSFNPCRINHTEAFNGLFLWLYLPSTFSSSAANIASIY